MSRLAGVVAMTVMVIAMPAGADFLSPQTSRRPEPRPEGDAKATQPAVPAPVVTEPVPISPGQRGDQTGIGAAIPVVPEPGKRDILRLDNEDYAACLASLRGLAAVFEEVKALEPDDDVDCGILQPIMVREILPRIALDPPAVIRCPTALALAAWVKDFVVPAAARLDSRGPISAIENGSDYICRRRNNLADGALSEHAFGNAFDVMGFRFAHGPALTIRSVTAEEGLESAFQDAIRAAACLEFSTVLGPGSNASHDNHLHLDIMARASGFRICELQGSIQK